MTQYELVHQVYFQSESEIDQRCEKSKFPETFKVLYNFYLKIEDILKSLEFIEAGQNFYSSQVLTRVLYEHFIVAYYIWTKARIDNNDECAVDYNEYYALFELMKRDNYNSRLDKTYESDKTPLENFLIRNPGYDTSDPLTQENVQDVNIRANKFDIRKIIKYLEEDLSEDDDFKPLHVLLHGVCKKYNRTSSYVHGGRLADLETFESKPPIDKGKLLKENLEFAKTFSYNVLSYIMLLLIRDDISFATYYQPIFDFIYNKNNQGRSEIGLS